MLDIVCDLVYFVLVVCFLHGAINDDDDEKLGLGAGAMLELTPLTTVSIEFDELNLCNDTFCRFWALTC